jgi:hypothetical protein
MVLQLFKGIDWTDAIIVSIVIFLLSQNRDKTEGLKCNVVQKKDNKELCSTVGLKNPSSATGGDNRWGCIASESGDQVTCDNLNPYITRKIKVGDEVIRSTTNQSVGKVVEVDSQKSVVKTCPNTTPWDKSTNSCKTQVGPLPVQGRGRGRGIITPVAPVGQPPSVYDAPAVVKACKSPLNAKGSCTPVEYQSQCCFDDAPEDTTPRYHPIPKMSPERAQCLVLKHAMVKKCWDPSTTIVANEIILNECDSTGCADATIAYYEDKACPMDRKVDSTLTSHYNKCLAKKNPKKAKKASCSAMTDTLCGKGLVVDPKKKSATCGTSQCTPKECCKVTFNWPLIGGIGALILIILTAIIYAS